MRLFISILCAYYMTLLMVLQCDSVAISYNSTISLEMLQGKRFTPDWESLDSRLLPEWFDRAKIGIFLHWGIYSVPGFQSEWFWYHLKRGSKEHDEFMKKHFAPGFTYEEFAPMFKAEFFEPDKLVELFAKAGAKYIVITSKHHDGYALFPSTRSNGWNSVNVGPHCDIVDVIANAVRQEGLKFGIYYSLYEWHNPVYLRDLEANFSTQFYVRSKIWPEIKQLVKDYSPSIIWADSDWSAPDTYWKSPNILAWLYNSSPVKNEIVVNDRWGQRTSCTHGDFYNCMNRYNPRKLLNHKWENAFPLDYHSWGYRRNINIEDVMPIHKLLFEVITTVSCGGNALINVGLTKEGTLSPIFQERLVQLGEWLQINGEAIYGSSPWMSQNDTRNGDVWYTCVKGIYNIFNPTAIPKTSEKLTAIYAIFIHWPKNINNVLSLFDITNVTMKGKWDVRLLGNENILLPWEIKYSENETLIYLPRLEETKSKNAWTLKFTQIV